MSNSAGNHEITQQETEHRVNDTELPAKSSPPVF